jgi:DNA-binding HxlR family transcriptional regulator
MKIRKNITCPLELTHDIIKGKWKPIIIWNLREKQSLSSLGKSINGIAQKMLLEHLKELIEFNIVGKNTFSGYPLKVEYYLTDRGNELLNAIVILQQLGTDIQAELKEKQKLYSRKSG